MMRDAREYLQGVEGMSFFKLMGSGRGLGFNPLPDWSVYSLLQVWETEDAALDFLNNSTLLSLYDSRSCERITFFLRNIISRGEWSNSQPFAGSMSLSGQDLPVAVLTRATIKNRHLFRFWKYVPVAQKPIEKAEGLIFTKGFGEVPVKQMVTFSIWDGMKAMRQYAYKSEEHARAITKTRKHEWFSEELFARFQLYKTQGSWKGIPVLQVKKPDHTS